MTPTGEWYPDPLIDEVRQRRRELYIECGNDLQKLLEAIQHCQAEHPEKVIDHRRHKKRATRTLG